MYVVVFFLCNKQHNWNSLGQPEMAISSGLLLYKGFRTYLAEYIYLYT